MTLRQFFLAGVLVQRKAEHLASCQRRDDTMPFAHSQVVNANVAAVVSAHRQAASARDQSQASVMVEDLPTRNQFNARLLYNCRCIIIRSSILKAAPGGRSML